MSSAVYPLGMNSMPSSGYNHKSTYYNKRYITWKGSGLNSNPTGYVSSHIRPLTNNDPGNVFPTGFGLPRPLKHYRKGRQLPSASITDTIINEDNPNDPNNNFIIREGALINYNLNRVVKSSKGTSLGGGAGGSGLLNELLDKPSSYIIKENNYICLDNDKYYLTFSTPNINSQSPVGIFLGQSYFGNYILAVNPTFNYLLISNDFGSNWNKYNTNNFNYNGTIVQGPSAYGLSSSGNLMYSSLTTSVPNGTNFDYYIYILKSDNYGKSWKILLIDSLLNSVNQPVIGNVISTNNDGSIVFFGYYDVNYNVSYLKKSNDYGETFTLISTLTNEFLYSLKCSLNGNYITLGTSNFIYYSNNGGLSFTHINTPSTLVAPIVMSGDGKYQLTCSLYLGNSPLQTQSKIYYSHNYGVTWNEYIFPTNIYWSWATCTNDGKNMYIVGSDKSINSNVLYISVDYGISWSLYSTLPGDNTPYDPSFNGIPKSLRQSISISADGSYLTYSQLGQTTDIFNIFINNCFSLKDNCKDCKGVSVVVDYYPNKGYLTENPEPNTTNPILCCNPEYKAKRRAIYASSNLNKNYYTTTKQYLQNRCKTYDQKAFNFLSVKSNNAGTYDNNNPYYATLDGSKAPKPGSPASLANTYLANCQLNTQLYEGSELAFIYKLLSIMQTQGILTQEQINNFNSSGINSLMGFFDYLQTLSEPSKTQALKVFELFLNDPYNGMPPSGPSNPAGCQLTVYKPNNYQYAKQGAVDSSTRNLKLNVSTISTNSASINNYNNTGQQLVTANQIYAGNNPNIINLQKNKGPSCGTQLPLNFYQSGPYQNKKFCTYTSLPQYINPQTQPSPYRYYPGTVFSSNHYSQSPNTYNTSSGSGRFR